MDAPESLSSVKPEEGIDFERLREIRDELVRLSCLSVDFEYHSTDLSLRFILWLTADVCLYLDFAAGMITPGTNVQQISPVIAWITQHWLTIFPPHSVATPIFSFCAALGVAVIALLVRIGIFMIVGRRIQAQLKQKLEHSQILSRFLAGWDELPEISGYMHHLARRFITWPIVTRWKPSPEKQQVRTFVANLDWYTQPPRRLWRWQWMNMVVRTAAGIACLTAQVASYFTDPGYNEPVTRAWALYLLVMLGSYLIVLATCLISAIVPQISAAPRARILLSKLKPVFEILGPEFSGRKVSCGGVAS